MNTCQPVPQGDTNGTASSLEECQSQGACQVTYNCASNGTCVSVQGNGGSFSSLTKCQKGCGCYSCVNGACKMIVNGDYSTLAICQQHCTPPPSQTKYSCNGGTCSPDTAGIYDSKEACQTVCDPYHLQTFSCNSGTCSPDSNGKYGTLAECQADCPQPPKKYSCNGGTCSPDTAGIYDSKEACQTVCDPYHLQTFSCNSGPGEYGVVSFDNNCVIHGRSVPCFEWADKSSNVSLITNGANIRIANQPYESNVSTDTG